MIDESKPMKRSARSPQQTDAAEEHNSAYRPKRRSRSRKTIKKPKKTAIGWRILFGLLAVILGLYSINTLMIGVFGQSTKATNVSLSFSKKSHNGDMNDYDWTLDYEYVVDGEEYSSFTTWHGTRYSPDSGTGRYHVNYLPFYPRISRFSKYNSIMEARDSEDIFVGGGMMLLSFVICAAATILLLVLSGVPWAVFAFWKRKKGGAKDCAEPRR